jgi:bifunctional non-homologous end joining protein LigD
MSLRTYQKKRNFGETPEPIGGEPDSSSLIFVVQKHQASRLHYDFRIELKGKLKSWAVPKGPSLDPKDKRLAMEVEDHPYDYKDFEGIIPKGNYGAGTVIVWDQGTYEPLADYRNKKQAETSIWKQWKEGNIKIKLHGQKLQGEFALVRIKTSNDNAWLLIKHKDEFSGRQWTDEDEQSIRSGWTLEETKANHSLSSPINDRQVVGPDQPILPDKGQDVLSNAPKKPIFRRIEPMLATLGKSLPNPYDDWIFEIKWDGYRLVARVDDNNSGIYSRKGLSFDDRFPMVLKAVQGLPFRAILDGELVALDDQGKPDFQVLQNYKERPKGTLRYYVFDVLWLEGRDTTSLPLFQRKAILESLLQGQEGLVKLSNPWQVDPNKLFEALKTMGMEGLMAKRKDSVYQQGRRSQSWIKVKVKLQQEAVVIGYLKKENSPSLFSSLLLAFSENGQWKYAGRVGTGFTETMKRDLHRKMKPLFRKTSPLKDEEKVRKGHRWQKIPQQEEIQWLRPVLVAQINYTEITEEGVFRHPVFSSLRDDKSPEDVQIETDKMDSDHSNRTSSGPITTPYVAQQKESKSKKFSITILKKTLLLSNLDKVLWPDQGITKGDMLDYYAQLSPYILPYLKDRPQSLHRMPNGIDQASFFQKDMTDATPDWVKLYPYKAKGDRKQKHYMLCQDKASLLFMANLGAIELHPWSSTIHAPANPTWCVLDLDPDTTNTFDQVIEVAQTIHGFLDEHRLPSYVKTSGSTGLHIYIPLGGKYTYDQSQLLAQWIVNEVDQLFDFTSTVRPTRQRKGKIYLDYLQNRPSATLAAPYSLRPKPFAPVSMPLEWSEVKKGLSIRDFHIHNTLQRVKEQGDLFKKVLLKGVDLKKIWGIH